MKRRIMLLICIVCIFVFTAAGAFARDQVRLGFNLAAQFAERPTLFSVQSAFDDRAKIFWGPSWEVIIDNVGFGMNYLVKFDRLSTGLEYPSYDWSLDWLGDLFVSYHVFGVGRLLDPFIAVGFGNAGRVDVDANNGYWVETSPGEWDYVYGSHTGQGVVSNMSLYPYIGAGLALDLGGVVLGSRVDYRPFVMPVPATQFPDYPLTNIQVVFTAAFALGG